MFVVFQEMLNRYGSVIWADSAEYFQSDNLTIPLQQAQSTGLVAWTIEDPTSAITHPKMFEFFKTKQELYYFHRAIETSHMILYDTPFVKHMVSLHVFSFTLSVVKNIWGFMSLLSNYGSERLR